MSAPDPVTHPLKVIDALFQQAVVAAGGNMPGEDFGVEEHFKSIITDGNIGNIPLLTKQRMTLGQLAPNSLVRYRGMVQDTFDVEFCPTAYLAVDASGNKQLLNCKYHDSIPRPEGMTTSEAGKGSRIPVYCVPIPAETQWARQAAGAVEAVPAVSASRPRKRRGLEEEEEEEEEEDTVVGVPPPAVPAAGSMPPPSAQPKRLRGPGEEEEDVSLGAPRMQVLGASDAEANSTEPMQHVAELQAHSPLPDTVGMPALIRMWSGNQPLMVGDMVEVVGVLTADPEDDMLVGAGLPQPGDTPEMAAMRAAWAMDRETAAKRPSSSLVARLHGIVYRKLNPAAPMLTVPLAAPGAFKLRGTTEHEVGVVAANSLAAADTPDKRNAVLAAAEKAVSGDKASTSALGAAATTALAGFLPTLPVPLPALRQKLVEYLAAPLGGDGLAAEWTLLHLLSSVTARHGDEAIGTMHLNITGLPDASAGAPTTEAPAPPAGAATGRGDAPAPEPPVSCDMPRGPLAGHMSPVGGALSAALAAILPREASVPLTIAHLNSLAFAPRKDYITNRLRAGVFQVPVGTHFTLDETVMRSGTLLPRGIENHRAITHLLAAGTLTYDFGYFPQHFPVDLPALVLSHTKSLWTADATLPLAPAAAAALNAGGPGTPPADAPLLDAARKYLACVRSLPYTLDPALEGRIQSDWTSARGANPKLTASDLHRWLALARLVTLSCGESVLTAAHWGTALALEEARMARVVPGPAPGDPGVGDRVSPHGVPGSPGVGQIPPSPSAGGLPTTATSGTTPVAPAPVRPGSMAPNRLAR